MGIIYGEGMKNQQRDSIMQLFRDGKFRILIATNVLARGIDILQVTLVINYDLPMTRFKEADPEAYPFVYSCVIANI